MDAAAKGASDGLSLALNVGAMLLAFIALIALANLVLGAVGGLFGVELTIQQLLGYVFAPIMFVVGVPWAEAVDAGSFLGQKVILNEFVAFSDFAPRAEEFSAKTQAVVTFALTGFANLGSLAILLGGLGGIAPRPALRHRASRHAGGARGHPRQPHECRHRRDPHRLRRERWRSSGAAARRQKRSRTPQTASTSRAHRAVTA
ncbi:nucleoside transporter C-terminal domain-containing protein [Georgenia sp. SUBG003]|uniref:nucleoside transporter C-terminal domain-containing protein n=1 Tax=Georgenia sp. SUBG003 TaxID=1497974 RepID=UPI003AB41D25